MKIKTLVKSLLITSVLLSSLEESVAVPTYLAGTVYDKVGKTERVDPVLLYAVSLTESALGSKKQTSPSMYAIRTPDGPLYPKTLPEAKQALANAVAVYGHKKIDVGLMQINGQHWKGLKNKRSLFNPFFNVTFGARILKTALSSTNDRVVGIGRYHSYTDWRAKTYGSRVMAIYNNLKGLE